MSWALAVGALEGRGFLDSDDDPRVGSGRNNATGGTLSHLSGGNSGSAASLGSTFVPVLIFSAVCLLIFFTLRRKSPRVYAPKTLSSIRDHDEQSPPLPNGWFDWLKPFFLSSDLFILNHCSLDAFFFLRYLRVIAIICAAGCLLTWPVLLPLHATGGRGLTQLDLLTIGNVSDSTKLYAHVVCGCALFGFIIFMICRESVYYIKIRQAFLLSSGQAQRLSSRTVLFTCVPDQYLEEARIRKLFGDDVKNVWIPKTSKALRKLVKERAETALTLEKAEIQLIKAANQVRNRQLGRRPNGPLAFRSHLTSRSSNAELAKTLSPDEEKASSDSHASAIRMGLVTPESPGQQKDITVADLGLRSASTTSQESEYLHPYGLSSTLPDVNGSVAALYLPAHARPSHRPLANAFQSTDTIKWTRQRLKTLSLNIFKIRRRYRGDTDEPVCVPAVFVEFTTQAAAQAAFQTLPHHQILQMAPRYIGIRPHEVVWEALRMPWWERTACRFLVMGGIAVAILFWSIPSAIVGALSNINSLAKISFLSWITSLPEVILGLFKGLVPALALSFLMSIVPALLRFCARLAGVPSLSLIELFVQDAYFIFQVIQVFLITTLTSAASAAFVDILKNPLSAKDLLSENLPKASNFYLSYILVQCLGTGASRLARVPDLFRHHLLPRISDDARKSFRRWHRLRVVHWGTLYPVFANMGVIAISYSCIAPLILVFAGAGMCFTHVVYRYNIMYVYDTEMIDGHGLFYPRALLHLMVGLYLAEICLIGLFALQSALPAVMLMVIFLVLTVLVHISLHDALGPFLANLPRSLSRENDGLDHTTENDTAAQQGPYRFAAVDSQAGAAAEYYNVEETFGEEDDIDEQMLMDEDVVLDAGTVPRGAGKRGIMDKFKGWVGHFGEVRPPEYEQEPSSIAQWMRKAAAWMTPDPDRKPNFFLKWAFPDIFEDYFRLRKLVEQKDLDIPSEWEDEFGKRGYHAPAMWQRTEVLWIPKDEARVSRQEVVHTSKSTKITDNGAWLNDRCRMVVDLDEAPWKPERAWYKWL